MPTARYALAAFLFLCIHALGAQPQQFTPTGSGGGGYMFAPSVNPHNHDDITLTCDMAGVYRSQDAGAHWSLYHYEQLVSTTKAAVQYTSDPNIRYTVRRSLTNQNTPLFRGEAVKSTDNGQNWQPITDPTETGVHCLFADPNSTQRLVLNEYNRLFFSNNGGQAFTEVFHPADDRMWLGGVFWDNQQIYIGTDKGLLVSHNGGQSFALELFAGFPAGQGIFHLSGAKQGTTTRLFVMAADPDYLNAWNDVTTIAPSISEVYCLNYGANAQWKNMHNNIPADAHLQWVDLSLQNINTVWVAGDINDLPQVYKSTDGGATWINTFWTDQNQNVQTGWGGDGGAFSYQWAGSPLGFDVADNDPNVIVATDGFSYTSTDGGAHWRVLHVRPEDMNPSGTYSIPDKNYRSSGLDVTTGHQLLFLNDHEIFAASTDIGNQYSKDGGDSWSFERNTFYPWNTVGNPNWYGISRDPNAPQTLYAAVSEINDIYLGYRIADHSLDGTGGMVLKSTDLGLHWDTLHDFGHPVVWLAQDQQHPERLFVSVVHYAEGGIFRSTDYGQNWEKLPLPARTEGRPYNIRLLDDGAMVVTFSARAFPDDETLTASSGVFYSPDGGDSWEDRTPPEMLYYTKDLVIDPNDMAQNTWFATVWGQFTVFPGPNNAGNGGLYRSRDRGLTWERIFAHERTESCTIYPGLPAVMYVSVEMEGLFMTNDLTNDQPQFARVKSFPFPRPKRMFFNPYKPSELWVSTMGGSFWKGQHSPTPVTEVGKGALAPSGFYLTPNPVSDQLILQGSAGAQGRLVQVALFDMAGKLSLEADVAAGQNVDVRVLPAGVYMVRIDGVEWQKIVKE